MYLSYKTEVELKKMLKKYGIRPSKGLGQNFLIDRAILEKIILAAELKSGDAVLEIGPGIGTLTEELAKRAKKVIAVEKDKKMAQILEETLKNFKNIEIIQNDVLKLNNFQLISNFKLPTVRTQKISNYKVVANLPYYISSPVIRKFLENPPNKKQPDLMVLMLQKEVAQRICSAPPDMSLLSVSVQFYAKPEIISYVSRNCFWPVPKVDSAIIKITPKLGGSPTPPELFFKLVKAGFLQPRKQLTNNLLALNRIEGSKIFKLSKKQISARLSENNINPSQRAETLSIEDWINLTEIFK